MQNWIDKYIYFDTVTLGQIVSMVLAAIISIIGLKKDFRSKTKKLQKEAKVTIFFICFLTITSITLIFISNYNSNLTKKELRHSFKNLQNSSDDLRIALNKNSIKESDLITQNQRQSAQDLKKAAGDLRDLINGSDSVPIFSFFPVSDTTLKAFLHNRSNKPVYNLNVRITNYDRLFECAIQTKKGKIDLNWECIEKNTKYLPEIVSLNGNTNIDIPLPHPISFSKSLTGKFYLDIAFKNKTYVEEVIYDFHDHHFFQALRILELNGFKIVKTIIYKDKMYGMDIAYWDKEFPFPIVLHTRKM